MNQVVRWGILGVAKINNRLAPAFRKSQTSQLVAIASRSAEKAAAAAQEFGLGRSYGSYEALLADPEIDAVYIPLPNHMHDEWTRKAADAGKHILCEKPLTPTAAEARALVAYCRAKGVRLMDGTMWPHHPRTARVRQMLDSGAIGQVRRVTTAFTFLLPPDPGNIRLQAQAAGGGLLDVGWYTVYGIRWAFGREPLRVYATATYEHGVDVSLNAILWFPDGKIAALDCGFKESLRMWLEVAGETGALRIPRLWLPEDDATFEIVRDGSDPERYSVPGHDQIVCMIDDIAAAIRENREPVPSADEAIRNMLVIDAIAQSAREGRVVEVVPFVDA